MEHNTEGYGLRTKADTIEPGPLKYLEDPNATTIPWTESPFFSELIDSETFNHLTTEERQIAQHFNLYGYVIVDSGLSDEIIEGAKKDAIELAGKPGTKTQVGYEYTDSPRIFEAWKTSENVRKIALNPKIINILKLLYLREPIPFQTINFLKGSGQPLHSDAIHFGTIPHLWIAAAWTALEDMKVGCGPLHFIPNSHKLPLFDYHDVKIKLAKFNTEEQFASYAEYEEFMRQLVKTYYYGEPTPFLGKKGQTIIWAANLIHGGAPITDPTLTRHSQASHYVFEGMQHFFVPRYSIEYEGQYAEKKLDKMDIRNTSNYIHP